MRVNRLLVAPLIWAVGMAGLVQAELPSGWEHADVGIPPGIPGDAVYDEARDVYTLDGNGEVPLYDPVPTADALQFAFKFASGDCEIIAHIADLENVNDWSRAGVMIRNALDPAAASVT